MTPVIGLAAWRLPVHGVAALQLARRVGADGVQFDLGGPGRGPWLDAPGGIDTLRGAAGELGVEVLGVAGNVLNDIGLTEPAAEAVIERLLDAAEALGAPLAFVPSFRRSAIDGPTMLARTAAVLRRAAVEGEARGVMLANENVLGPEDAVTLADEVGSPLFRLLLDTYNPRAAGVDVSRLIAHAAKHFADQIHVKDGVAGTDRTPLLGDGDGEVDEALAAVSRHLPATRALVLENDYRDGDEARLAADLARARAYAEGL
ncbi:TIM barrel protein [Streptomyces sp. NPDC000410]|uniref:sugar phosphate isomerase/epimerase family protein n=1 Tax=Streptomyces sp. NPDC000410 TaxID=3154254 RepID=UPI003330EC42